MKKAVIYCRVSSRGQKTDGDSRRDQDSRGKKYADANAYTVQKIFYDDSTGGGDFLNRPAMKSLLEHLDNDIMHNYVVIFADLKRFARDTKFHWELRSALDKRKAIPKCLNYNFDDSAEGRFVETVFASLNQLELEQNQRQVCQKMKTRMERGYWCFHQPPAYKFIKAPIHGKLIQAYEPQASILREALEMYADGIIDTQLEFQNYLIKKDFKTQRNGKLTLETCKRMLTQILYAGYIEYPDWEIPRFKAIHEGIISLATFEKIQQKLTQTGKDKARKDLHKDFPLRGYVLCETCDKAMTSSWSTGARNKFPYYRCRNRECTEYGKGIRKEKLETEVEGILKKMTPTSGILKLLKAIVLDVWKTKMTDVEAGKSEKQSRLNKIEAEQKNLLQNIRKASNEIVRRAFEDEVAGLEKEKTLLKQHIEKTNTRNFDFEKGLEQVFAFIENPYEIWTQGDFAQKRMVLKLVFPKQFSYDRITGVGTLEMSLPFKLAGHSERQKTSLVEVARVELASKEET